MKNSTSKRNIVRTILMAIAILLPACLILSETDLWLAGKSEAVHRERKRMILHDLMSEAGRKSSAEITLFDEKIRQDVNLFSVCLRELTNETGYYGERIFEGGFVVEQRGDTLLLPQGLPSGKMMISPELIAESITSAAVRTGLYVQDESQAGIELVSEEDESMEDARLEEGSAKDGVYYLSFGRITDTLFYVQKTSRALYLSSVNRYISGSMNVIETADQTFGACTVTAEETNGKYHLISTFKDLDPGASLSELGITAELFQTRQPEIRIEGRDYACSYSEYDNGLENGKLHVLHLIPRSLPQYRNEFGILVISGIIFLVFGTIIIYVLSVRDYAENHILSEEMEKRYSRGKIRQKMIVAGIVGAFTVVLMAMICHGAGMLRTELKLGRDILHVSNVYCRTETDNLEDLREIDRDQWSLSSGHRLADLLCRHPELAEKQILQRCSDILNASWIMLFDSEGNETLSSNDYSGISLMAENETRLADFQRLLYGIPEIIRNTSMEDTGGKTERLYGVTMKDPEAEDRHGALILAHPLDSSVVNAGIDDINSELRLFADASSLCFAAEENSGAIVYSSVDSMVGNKIEKYGLEKNALQDGYMDYLPVDGERSFITSAQYGSLIFFYTVEYGRVVRGCLLYGGIAFLAYFLTFVMLMWIYMRKFKKRSFSELSQEMRIGEEEDKDDPAEETDDSWTAQFKDLLGWHNNTPEGRVAIVFRVGMFVLLLVGGQLLIASRIRYGENISIIDFLLRGEWMRGLNIFAICSILLISAEFYMLIVLSDLLFSLGARIMNGHGETVCMLLKNLVKYISVFAWIYLSLQYLGFPMDTIIASLGLVSLALSLGARDLAADIIAGLFIMIENSFNVGDIVRINKDEGTVLEIGVRSTKLKVSGDHIKVIGNHNISDIENLSKQPSKYSLIVELMTEKPIEEIEKILKKELPVISEGTDLFVAPLEYRGIRELSGIYGDAGVGCMKIEVVARYREKNKDAVRAYLNKEIRILLEKYGM